MLHLTRAAVAFSMSAQSGASMVAVIGCPGGTQELALRVTCPAAGADATSAASPNPRIDFTDRKSTRLNSSHGYISYAVFCLKKKKQYNIRMRNARKASSTRAGAPLCSAK